MENFVVRYYEKQHMKVRLPKEFTSMFAYSLENPLEMLTSNGVIWNVEFATYYDEVWLTSGWSKVAEWFNFSQHDFVVFRYSGRSSFKVSFFDNHGIRKLPADVPPRTKSAKTVIIIHKDDYTERMRLPNRFCQQIQFRMSNTVLVMTDDGSAIPVNWIMKGGTICLTYGWRKVVRMIPDNIADTRRHYRLGMTIGRIQRSNELGEAYHCQETDHARNMRLFNAIDYMVVVYNTNTEKYIKLPSGFVGKWGSSMESPLFLRTGDDNVRMVQFGKYQEEIWLLEGWSSVANDFNLGSGDVLLFEYYGKSCFNLLCFNSNYHEKRPDPNWVPFNTVNMFTMFRLNCYKDTLMLPSWFAKNFRRTLQNPVKVRLDDGSEWVVNWITIERNIWLDAGWGDVARHCDFKYEDFLFMVVTNNSEINIRVVKRAANRLANAKEYIRRVFAFDGGFGNERVGIGGIDGAVESQVEIDTAVEENVIDEEIWKTVITDSMIKHNHPLYIPASVVRTHLANKTPIIDVVLPNGEMKEWSFIWRAASGKDKNGLIKGYFGKGWYEFVSSTNLQVGMQIRFNKRVNEKCIRLEVTE